MVLNFHGAFVGRRTYSNKQGKEVLLLKFADKGGDVVEMSSVEDVPQERFLVEGDYSLALAWREFQGKGSFSIVHIAGGKAPAK